MKAYIDKSTLVAELNRLIAELVEEGEDTMFEQGRISAFEDVKVFINHTLELKEINNVWHDTRRTIPEDGSEQIICIKEDGLAVSTVGKIVNGTIKWAYLGDLLYTNSFNVEVKEVEEEPVSDVDAQIKKQNKIIETLNENLNRMEKNGKN